MKKPSPKMGEALPKVSWPASGTSDQEHYLPTCLFLDNPWAAFPPRGRCPEHQSLAGCSKVTHSMFPRIRFPRVGYLLPYNFFIF